MESLLYFLLWAGLFLVLMRFGCGAHIMGHQRGHDGARSERAQDPKDVGWVPPEKDVDPVCGKTVETASAKSAVHDRTVYYFCSADCRERFEASPSNYVGAKQVRKPQGDST